MNVNGECESITLIYRNIDITTQSCFENKINSKTNRYKIH